MFSFLRVNNLIDELAVLKIVIKKLKSADIPYMVSGSIAANFYMTPRMTRDIDIVIQVETADAERIYSLFLILIWITSKDG